MTLLRSPVRAAVRNPVFSPSEGVWAEPSPTNLFVAPNDLTNAAWVKFNVTTPAVNQMRETTATNDHRISQTVNKAAGVLPYRTAFKFTGVNRTRMAVYVFDASFNFAGSGFFRGASFVPGSGGFTGGMIPLLNGEYECVLNFTSLAATTLLVGYYIESADGVTNFAGNASNGANLRDMRLSLR